jgi:phosphoglycerol transferase MdoB-like AlkP superfamily enzyme
MHNAIRYSDFALQQFFNKAKTTSWYANTLFIIVADHTPASGTDIYYKDMGNMHIPLVFFHPSNPKFKGRNDKVVGQEDIMPTILDLLGYSEPFFAFGQSVFDPRPGYSASNIGNKFIYFADIGPERYMLTYQDETITGIYNLKDQLQINNLMTDVNLSDVLITKLKAMIQTYNKVLINNKMTIH